MRDPGSWMELDPSPLGRGEGETNPEEFAFQCSLESTLAISRRAQQLQSRIVQSLSWRQVLRLWALLLLLLGGLLDTTGLCAETLLLSGATVHTITGETLAPGDVLIRDGKIAAVEK